MAARRNNRRARVATLLLRCGGALKGVATVGGYDLIRFARPLFVCRLTFPKRWSRTVINYLLGVGGGLGLGAFEKY